MADRVESDKRSCDEGGGTNRAYERTPLANPGTTWRRADIGIKDNGPGCLVVYVSVRVILVRQRCSDAEIAKQDGTVVVDEEICCFDIPVDKTIGMEITTREELRE